MTLLASLDGSIGPPDTVMIPVTDEGLLRGDGGFEVVRVYGGRPFALDDHFARLGRTLAGLRLEADLDALRAEAEALVRQAEEPESLLRLVVTRAGRRIAIVEPLPSRPSTARVMTVTYTPTRVLDRLKTLSYAANMLAGRLAKEQGFDEALFVTPHGGVLEGTTWTFFWVRDGIVRTPPLSDRILDSITRDRVLRWCDGIVEEQCVRDDLARAEEAFIASSVREIMPIAAIDDRELPSAPGPLTDAIAARVRQGIADELAASAV